MLYYILFMFLFQNYYFFGYTTLNFNSPVILNDNILSIVILSTFCFKPEKVLWLSENNSLKELNRKIEVKVSKNFLEWFSGFCEG
jgi:hypothetical protein